MVFEPRVDKSWCGATSSAICSFDKWAPYLKRRSGTLAGEYRDKQMSGEDNVLLMPRVADLV